MEIKLSVEHDGSFTIETNSIRLSNCFPGVNGEPIRPLKVNHTVVNSTQVLEYSMATGRIVLQFSYQGNDLIIKSTLCMPGCKVLWFYPVYKSRVDGVRGFYRQGLGICGPSGYVSLDTFKKNDNILNMFKSYGMTVLVGTDTCQAIFPEKQERFTSLFDITKLDREDYRELMSIGFNVEGTDASQLTLPQLRINEARNLQEALDYTATTIAHNANVNLQHKPPLVWCSWYYLFHTLSHDILTEYLNAFAALKPSIPFEYIQIDAGYFSDIGDWLTCNSLWPKGLKAAFDEISQNGYKPGIWIGPYMVGNRSKLFEDHPDWILRRLDDSPVIEMRCYNEPKMWGLRDEEFYVLDTSNPGAMEYLRQVFRTLKQWGVQYFKTDFMLWGLQDSAKVKRFTPGKTSVEYMIDLLKVIREEIKDSYWLGCIAPFYPFLGFADAMRIAADVGAVWNESEFSTGNVIREVVGSNYMNHVYWHNDPDAMIIRDFHVHLKPEEIESLCLLQAVSGGLVATSDPFHEISEARRELFQFVLPHAKVKPRIPSLGSDRKEIVMAHNLGNGRHILFAFNPTSDTIVNEYLLHDTLNIDKGFVLHWNSREYSSSFKTQINVKIPPHGCALYFISENEQLPKQIKNIWDWDKTL